MVNFTSLKPWLRGAVSRWPWRRRCPSFAVQPSEMLPDPAQEARAREISKELRCLVCQNQSIDDSDAGLAKDLRILVRERIKAGDSDSQVLDFLVARYGDFVRLRPPFDLSDRAAVAEPAGHPARRRHRHRRSPRAAAAPPPPRR